MVPALGCNRWEWRRPTAVPWSPPRTLPVAAECFFDNRAAARETRFGPALVRRLLGAYPNLYFDLSVGEPGRHYQCADRPVDTVIWETRFGHQTDTVKPAYREILTKYSDRFVAGFDYGPANRQSERFLRSRIANIRLIIRDLPDAAKHDIGYRTAWRLLTGRDWK